jgi:hypothetical protein
MWLKKLKKLQGNTLTDRQNKRSGKEKKCVEGMVQRKDRWGKKEKWKRLNRAVKCMTKFEKRTWEILH